MPAPGRGSVAAAGPPHPEGADEPPLRLDVLDVLVHCVEPVASESVAVGEDHARRGVFVAGSREPDQEAGDLQEAAGDSESIALDAVSMVIRWAGWIL